MTQTKSQKDKKSQTGKVVAKKKKVVTTGVIHVFASFNNTIISISDTSGNAICWSSAGKQGFKGSRKATPYAAQVATQNALEIAKTRGLKVASVEIRGPGVGRDASLKAIQGSGVSVTIIKDITHNPHNGCRPPKRRRV